MAIELDDLFLRTTCELLSLARKGSEHLATAKLRREFLAKLAEREQEWRNNEAPEEPLRQLLIGFSFAVGG